MKSKEGKERWREFVNACVIYTLRLLIAQSQRILYLLSCTRAYYDTDMRRRSQTIILAR